MNKQHTLDSGIVERGQGKIRWAEQHMRLLARLRGQFAATKPFAGLTIGICLHVEPKTAVLCDVLRAGGAEVVVTGNLGTTQDDIVAALRRAGFLVFGQRDDDNGRHLENIRQVLQHRPHLLLDNGAALVFALLDHPGPNQVVGGTEETTTGANRLREELGGKLMFPVIVINDSPLKLIMENERGVGPTVVEGFMRSTNLLVPAKRFVVFGYGSVGRGIARCLRSAGGRVMVVEPDPIRALEAALDGMQMQTTVQAFIEGEVFITATGRPSVIAGSQLSQLPDGAILINAGHFSSEIDLAELRKLAVSADVLTDLIEVFTLPDGKHITLLAGGEMLNLAGGGGNPVETMDLGLALQAHSLRYIAERYKELPHEPQPIPREINIDVARSMVEVLSRT